MHLLIGQTLKVIIKISGLLLIVQNEQAGTGLLLVGDGADYCIQTTHCAFQLEARRTRPIYRKCFEEVLDKAIRTVQF
jgi:hypothetical protein